MPKAQISNSFEIEEMNQIPFFPLRFAEQRNCIECICKMSQFPRIKGESSNGWPKAVILLEICALGTTFFEITCTRSQINRLNDVTVSRISVRLG